MTWSLQSLPTQATLWFFLLLRALLHEFIMQFPLIHVKTALFSSFICSSENCNCMSPDLVAHLPKNLFPCCIHGAAV